jgi:hypothetical protein
MARKIVNASDFFDILSSMKGGCFATIGYVTGANLKVPTKKKMPDYSQLASELGHDNLGGVVKLTSYTLNWSTPDSIAKAYGKYKTDLDALRNEYGLEPTETRKSWSSKQEFGDNGVKVYSGDNQELRTHSYTSQNVHNARIKSMYYLIDTDGKVIRGCDKNELLNYFKGKTDSSSVNALKKMGADEEKIKEFIEKEKALGMRYQTFEASNILYMVATVNGEKIVYINENLSQCVKNVNIIPAEFTKIAKERYQIDFATLQEAMENAKHQQLLMENGIMSLNWLD